MTKQIYQIILVDESLENYHLIETFCEQLNQSTNFFYQLSWLSTLDLINNLDDSCLKKIYLIAARQLPSLNSFNITQLKSRCHSDLIIILVNDFETGMIAIKAGATDYLDLSELSLPALERSFRLAISLNGTSSDPTKQIGVDFQAIFEQAGVGIALLATSGQFLCVNQPLCQLLGYTQAELTNLTFPELTHPDDLQAFYQHTEQILSNALSVERLTARYLCKHGQWHWVNLTTSLVKDSQNKPLYLLVIFQNWQLKQTEAQLQISEALYQGIFNHSSEGIFLLSIQSKQKLIYEAINPSYEQIIAKKQTEIIGKTIQEVLPSEIADLLLRQYHTCLDTLNAINYEQTIELTEATRNWRITLIPIFDEKQQITKLQGSIRDITEEKSAITTQLRYTRYRHLLRSITLDIRQSLDLETILQTTVNQLQTTLNAERVVLVQFLPDGTSQITKEVVVADLLSLKNQNDLTSNYWQKLAKFALAEHFYLEQDCDCQHFSLTDQKILKKYTIRTNLVLPIFHRQAIKNNQITSESKINHLWGLLSVQQCSQPRQWTRDEIELLQQLVGQLNIALAQSELLESEIKQRQELARSNAELEQFAYVASHDLQAPLQTISNYVQLIERRYREKLDFKADKYINYIVDAVQRMRTQINDLLEYSRVGREKNTLRATDCNIVLEQALANLRSEIEQNQVIITCLVDLPTLIADFSQLVVLWQNLIGNSIKYRSRLQPLIEINVQFQENNWQFSIGDNGIGIEPRYQQRIFQIFQRLHTQEEYSGTGIGLAICQKIVQRHGGRIWVESQLGQGAKFYFILPNLNQ